MSIVRHRTNFQNRFNQSPQEFHAANSFPRDAKCQWCQSKPSVRAIVMAPLDEAEKRGIIPPGASKIPRAFPEVAPVLVPIKTGGDTEYYIRISKVYSCSMCRVEFERALAKGPSWLIVEINEGPDPRGRVQVGRS